MLFSADYSESMLYAYFHEFYREVVRLKQLIRSNSLLPAEAAPFAAEGMARLTPVYVQQQLLPILERQRLDAAHRGGEHGATLYREAQYLMAALADEIFLHIVEWEGRENWRAALLEAKLFDTYIAGERVFQNLDRLLGERNPVYADLARIYLIALALGFEGKYRNLGDDRELEHYRRELFTFITKRNPEGLRQRLYDTPERRLFPDAYAFTVKEPRAKPLPSLRKWYVVLALTVLGVLLTSHLLWRHYTSDLHSLTQSILQEREF